MYFLGYDIGSSSIKAAIVDGSNNRPVAVVNYPETEMNIDSPNPGWAEQDPEMWWENAIQAGKKAVAAAGIDAKQIEGIGISYQMHGLVTVDKNQKVLRPSIIWCDSRAVEIGNKAFDGIGHQQCFSSMLNSPGNFTASKLKWVKENEPALYEQIDRFMLPGDYVAMKLTGEINTTISGLSEGIIWDFQTNAPSKSLFDYMGFDESMVPEVKPTFSVQGEVSASAAEKLGIRKGIPVGYRAGDQPNNAMSLGVLSSGEVAGTGGTSGVVYGVNSKPVSDAQNRVNSFAHVNYTPETPNVGVLLCINGSGIQYRWINQQVATEGTSYFDMEKMMSGVPVGADGLRMLPFGNGAERILGNRDIGSHIQGLQFNRHTKKHLFRAALEGIAFSFAYGIDIMTSLGMDIRSMRVGNDNLFQSEIFSNTIATLMDGSIEVVETTGAVGAARAVGFTVGHFSSLKEAMSGDKVLKTYEPQSEKAEYEKAYTLWKQDLEGILN
ncbi:xylulokinase [Marinoscillum sp. MHG1-6]|uniref:xylulokinase n=1 Tax=Marinoscillum sp. MHG1-6 TaxID=2959627 RepID=UPI0021573C24|nr:FGGY family carbohydrate kinase [Marinoscillum sp. MHG1-6]